MTDQTPTLNWLEAEAELVSWLAQREGITEPADAVRAIVGVALEGLVVVPADEPLYRIVSASPNKTPHGYAYGWQNAIDGKWLWAVPVYPKEGA